MTSPSRERADGVNRVILTVAAMWSVALVGAAFFVHTNGATMSTGSARLVRSSATLVQVNGLKVLFPVALPLAVVGVVATARWHRRRTDRHGPGVVALAAVALLGALSLVGILTIGIFILPVTMLLLVVCSRSS